MISLLAILPVSLSASSGGQTQSTDDEVRLRAKVQAIVPLASYLGAVTPVDVDPRFALTVRIESAVPAVTNFTSGAVVTFAIHSPSLLFGGPATKGKTYDFSLRRKVEDGKIRFFGLKVRKVWMGSRHVSARLAKLETRAGTISIDENGVNQALGERLGQEGVQSVH